MDKRMEHLDRYNVDCGESMVLTSFQLESTACSSQHRFKYTCANANITSITSQSTPCDQLKDQTGENLDRFNVNCPNGCALTQFQASDSGCSGNDMKFKFKCAAIEGHPENYTTTNSACDQLIGKNMENLDRFMVKCNDGPMKRFQAQSACGGDNMNFQTYCLKTFGFTASPTKAPTAAPTKAPTGY